MRSKQQARASARRHRADQPAPTPAAVEELLADFLELLKPTSHAARVALYVSTDTEPPTHSLITSLLARDIEVRVPRVRLDDVSMDWVQVTSQSAWSRDSRNLRAPKGLDMGLDDVTLILIPALRASASGDRLGQGGGFYDRALAALARGCESAPRLVGLVFEDELLDAPDWPVEAHDQRLDHVLTMRREPRPE